MTIQSCGCSTGNTCNVCGYNPCRCLVVPCTKPSISVDDLLKLIALKCDEATCKYVQTEVDLLYDLLNRNKPKLGEVPPKPLAPLPYQLVSNMVDSLHGDLTDKYPSAQVIKDELLAIWKCMAHKQQHHGDWDKNFSYRDVTASVDSCLLDGQKDYAPGRIRVTTPVDVGSTVFNTVKDEKGNSRRCLFESLIDNNTIEPSKLSVLEGKWINYCDITDAINCVLPRKIITNCHQNCDDPNQDGVHEELTLCERLNSTDNAYFTVIKTLPGNASVGASMQDVSNPGGGYTLQPVKVTGSEWTIPVDGWYKSNDLMHVEVVVNQPDTITCNARTQSYIALDNVEIELSGGEDASIRGEGSFSTIPGKAVDQNWVDGSGSSIFWAKKGQVVTQWIGAKADPAQPKTGIKSIRIERPLTGYTIHRIAKNFTHL